ncbi:MAG: TlpA family protein disulfide reductase [Planctomycetota bacterium JB042]
MLPSLLFFPMLLSATAAPPLDDAVAAGERALLASAEALRRPFRDDVVVEASVRGVPVRVEYVVTFGDSGLGRLERGPVSAILEDDWASVVHAAKPDAYFVAEASGAALEDLLQLVDPGLALLPHVALRAAEEGVDAVEAMAIDWDDEVRLVGCEESAGADGDARVVVTLAHANGEETIELDAETHRLVRREATRGDVRWIATHAVRPTDGEDEIAPFEPGERTLTRELLGLLRAAAGDPAPAFAAPGLDGAVASLDALRDGRVVVLDFWATWCRPCIKGLKDVERFAAEADPEQVRVVAVNVSEKLEEDDRVEAVGAFWERAGHRFPTLIDFDDSIRRAYGAAEIPLTVVVGPDGTIRAAHPEEEPLLEWLRRETAAARR